MVVAAMAPTSLRAVNGFEVLQSRGRRAPARAFEPTLLAARGACGFPNHTACNFSTPRDCHRRRESTVPSPLNVQHHGVLQRHPFFRPTGIAVTEDRQTRMGDVRALALPAGNSRNRGASQEEVAVMNERIRAPRVRLLGEDNTMLGVVTREEALEAAKLSNLDLVLVAGDADPPVARIMDFGKYRYEQQKKKKDQQRRSAVNRQEIKELKMRYNIDIGDYNVRLKQAIKFLKDGDKVKVTAQFRGREMEFKELGMELFKRFATDLAQIGVVETKAHMEGKSVQMVLIPDKGAIAKKAAADKKKQQEGRRQGSSTQGSETEKGTETLTDEEDVEDDDEDDEDEGEEGEGGEREEVKEGGQDGDSTLSEESGVITVSGPAQVDGQVNSLETLTSVDEGKMAAPLK